MVIWQAVLDAIDAVESWVVGQSYWVQVILLLAVLGPLCWGVAGLIDRGVEAVLASHSRRDAAAAPDQPPAATGGTGAGPGSSTAQAGEPPPERGDPESADSAAPAPAPGPLDPTPPDPAPAPATMPGAAGRPEPVAAAARTGADRPARPGGRG